MIFREAFKLISLNSICKSQSRDMSAQDGRAGRSRVDTDPGPALQGALGDAPSKAEASSRRRHRPPNRRESLRRNPVHDGTRPLSRARLRLWKSSASAPCPARSRSARGRPNQVAIETTETDNAEIAGRDLIGSGGGERWEAEPECDRSGPPLHPAFGRPLLRRER